MFQETVSQKSISDEQEKANVATIILAAGYSSRMHDFKPLLPFVDSILVDVMAEKFRSAGVNDILVVYGYHAEQMKAHLLDLPVIPVHNPDYDSGMFSSVLTGVKKIDEMQVDAFFVIPVDYPLIKPSTPALLTDSMRKSDADIFYPTYEGERGHPVLISSKVIQDILSHDGKNGLYGALLAKDRIYEEVDVDDRGILLDMDTHDDYENLLGRYANENSISD